MTAKGQKLVIGSQIPSFKGITWLTAPPKTDKDMLIDFYQSTNPSCEKFLPTLAPRYDLLAPKLSFVILTREQGPAIDKLVNSLGARYSIGYDPTGDAFNAFNVKYLPYSILVDEKGKILWIGNLGNLDDQSLLKIDNT